MKILSRVNMEAHEGRPLTPEFKKLNLWNSSDAFLHCCIESKGCRFSKESGACIMCDYGTGRNLNPDELHEELEKQVVPYIGQINTILIGTYGSIFDESEVSGECFEVILDFLVRYKVSTVIFETHCSTVSDEKLKKIKEKLSKDTRIIIEMGYESCDKYVLQYSLNKIISLKQLQGAITLIHKYSMKVCLNVLLGAPFLCAQDQLDSALKSIQWAFEQKADSVVIFPINIKPFTLLYKLYEKGLVAPISQWMLVDLLAGIPEKYLGKISLSWYGDRNNFYENNEFPLIPPLDCSECHDRLFTGYSDFMKATDLKEKARIINEIKSKQTMCTCREQYHQQMNVWLDRKTPYQIEEILRKM